MTTENFITELFCKVDDQMQGLTKHSQAKLWPSEVTTIGLRHAIKGIGTRAFYRWLDQNHRDLFPGLPHRTRLFRLLRRHQDWCDPFLAKPSLLNGDRAINADNADGASVYTACANLPNS